MRDMARETHKLLLEKQKSVAVAESCTGGLISNLLTGLSGSSRYFTLGIVAYSNKAKIGLLKIPVSLIAKKGAVSREVAERMAAGIKRLAQADFGLGITGIAGPGGATKAKPVGTVFIALDSKNKKTCKRFLFKGNRSAVRKSAALKSLELLNEFF